MPFESDGLEDEPIVFALGRQLYQVIGESADGAMLIMPLNMVILRDAGDDVLELKKEHRAE